LDSLAIVKLADDYGGVDWLTCGITSWKHLRPRTHMLINRNKELVVSTECYVVSLRWFDSAFRRPN
jgi:hypothetical protein